MAARQREGDENASPGSANPCKKARIDDDLLRRTMATIGAPPEAPPEPSKTPPRDVVRHLETHGYCPLIADASDVDALRAALADISEDTAKAQGWIRSASHTGEHQQIDAGITRKQACCGPRSADLAPAAPGQAQVHLVAPGSSVDL